MSVSGLCQICESAEAEHSCTRCGAFACDRHFDSDHGMCSACVAETTKGGGETPTGGRQFDDDDVPGEYEY